MSSQTTTKPLPRITEKALQALASDIYQKLKSMGCRPRQMVKFSSHLLGLVTKGIQNQRKH